MAAVSIIYILLCALAIILIFGGIGVFLVISSLRNQKKAEVSKSWPGTAGTILRTEVKQSQGTADEQGVSQTSYYPFVEYDYFAGGQSYRSDKIAFGARRTYNSQSEAASILSKYPEGGQVQVYYNPANPSEAVLERKPAAGRSGLIVGIVFLVLSLCIGCAAVSFLAYSFFAIA
jgi:hypothetical protein